MIGKAWTAAFAGVTTMLYVMPAKAGIQVFYNRLSTK